MSAWRTRDAQGPQHNGRNGVSEPRFSWEKLSFSWRVSPSNDANNEASPDLDPFTEN